MATHQRAHRDRDLLTLTNSATRPQLSHLSVCEQTITNTARWLLNAAIAKPLVGPSSSASIDRLRTLRLANCTRYRQMRCFQPYPRVHKEQPMKWRTGRRSTNVEDRRGSNMGGVRTGGSRAKKMGGGIGGMGLILILIVFLTGGDPLQMLGQLAGSGGASNQPSSGAGYPSGERTRAPAGNDEQADFVTTVLGFTEDVWTEVFASLGSRYQPPTLVLFNDSVQSACGMSTAATGPFYCPGDYKVYIDLSFFDQLRRMGAPGDFAQAYVIGHEVAHHIQNLQGISMQVQKTQRRVSQTQANQLSVMTELQADCYAGVWAHHAAKRYDLLERGDIEEGLQAAASIGDDTLQRNANRRVQPESFTHGSSAQRVEWFKRGLISGEIKQCDTFAGTRS